MKTFPIDLYKLIAFGLGGENWQQFVDNYNEIYDTENIEGFEKVPTKLSYNWEQLLASTGATPLPAYVDPESPGYEFALKEVRGNIGNIPTFKAFYSLNRTILRERLMLINKMGEAALNSEMQNVFLGMIDETTEGLIKSYVNALTHQRMQIVSKGQFTIDSVNNPRGIQGVTIDFNIDSTHKETLSGQDRWWTNSAHTTEGTSADPIGYIRKRLKEIKRTYHTNVPLQLEISDVLWEDLKTHTKVLTFLGWQTMTGVISATDADALAAGKRILEAELLGKFAAAIGIPVKVRDSKACVLTPNASTHTLDETYIDNFDEKNIAFVPQGKIGEIQGVSPLTLGYDSDKVAFFDGDRLALTQRANPETHSIYIESEAAQICVPTAINHMYISTVTL